MWYDTTKTNQSQLHDYGNAIQHLIFFMTPFKLVSEFILSLIISEQVLERPVRELLSSTSVVLFQIPVEELDRTRELQAGRMEKGMDIFFK